MTDDSHDHVVSSYEERFPLLVRLASDLEGFLREEFGDVPRVDLVKVRAKSPERFGVKARKLLDTGQVRYRFPLHDIQDQIAARIVVFYKSDVEPVVEKIRQVLREIEDLSVIEGDPDRFGYQAHHMVCFIPRHLEQEHHPPVKLFELQVATLFQHAWAEANHDIIYKPRGELTPDDRRRTAWAAAQAWGADQVFDELWRSGGGALKVERQ